MADSPDPRVFIPVLYGDEQRLMLIDSGAPQATIAPSLAAKLGVRERDIPEDMLIDSSGKAFKRDTIVPLITIAGMRFHDVHAFIEPNSSDDKMGGAIGADLLRRVDVEFNFANQRVNFFSQDHCPGNVVYWPAAKTAAVPMRILQAGYPVIPVSLGGHTLDAVVDTGSTDTLLEIDTARSVFGITPDSPGVKKEDHPGPGGQALYTYTFPTLDFEGIAISNVPVYLYRDLAARKLRERIETGTRLPSSGEENGTIPLSLGMHEMRQLHMYFSYKERVLYLTPPAASAH